MQSLKSFVGAVGLEDAASHELDRLRWSFKEKEFELERKGWENERRVWEMERKRWEREREALLEALEREKRDREMREAAEGVKEERLAEVGVYWLADDGGELGRLSSSLLLHPLLIFWCSLLQLEMDRDC